MFDTVQNQNIGPYQSLEFSTWMNETPKAFTGNFEENFPLAFVCQLSLTGKSFTFSPSVMSISQTFLNQQNGHCSNSYKFAR